MFSLWFVVSPWVILQFKNRFSVQSIPTTLVFLSITATNYIVVVFILVGLYVVIEHGNNIDEAYLLDALDVKKLFLIVSL